MTTERAGWWTRAGAQIIDGLIITAFTFVILIVVSIAGGGDTAGEIALYAGAGISSMLYGTLLLPRAGANNGQTIGKHAMGIRVVLPDGAPITLGLAAKREILGRGLLGLIPLYSIVDVLWPLSDSGKQALHDKVAGTFVVPAASDSGTITVSRVYAEPTPPLSASADAAPHEPAPLPQAPQPAPDLGGFAPPVEQPEPPPTEDIPGPFGPSYDD